MSKMLVSYIPGSGGHWLKSLVYDLQKNKNINNYPPRIHYHLALLSKDVTIMHDFNLTYKSDPTVIFYGGPCRFNFYLNLIHKLLLEYQTLNEKNWREQIAKLQYSAYCVLSLYDRVDIDYTWLYKDQKKFISVLFDLLDQHDIIYNKNEDICYSSIEYFKLTAINPAKHFNNFNDVAWVGWCYGLLEKLNIMHISNLSDFDNWSDLVINIQQYSELINKHTLDNILFYD